jgi:hypothetical protein
MLLINAILSSRSFTSMRILGLLKSLLEECHSVATERATTSIKRVLQYDMSHAPRTSSLCGCTCDLEDGQLSCDLAWERCHCVLCGEDGCRTLVSPVLRVATLDERGIQPQNVADIEASPNYCGECRDYCLLEIRRTAVLRSRAKRQLKEAESKTKAMIQRGALRSRSPLHEKRKSPDRGEKGSESTARPATTPKHRCYRAWPSSKKSSATEDGPCTTQML